MSKKFKVKLIFKTGPEAMIFQNKSIWQVLGKQYVCVYLHFGFNAFQSFGLKHPKVSGKNISRIREWYRQFLMEWEENVIGLKEDWWNLELAI